MQFSEYFLDQLFSQLVHALPVEYGVIADKPGIPGTELALCLIFSQILKFRKTFFLSS